MTFDISVSFVTTSRSVLKDEHQKRMTFFVAFSACSFKILLDSLVKNCISVMHWCLPWSF